MNRTPGQMPDAILFDLDNTLCTFTDAKRAACKAVVEYLGCGNADDLFRYFLRTVHGFEDPLHIHDYLHDTGTYSREFVDNAVSIFEEIKILHVEPYPGVKTSLKKIFKSGIPMAIVTDASITQAKKRIIRCELSDYFPVVITPESSGKRKPDHIQFTCALQELQISSSNIWLVGDSIRREMIPGNELGFTTVYARYGDWIGGNKDEQPVFSIDTFSDLLPLLGIDS